MGEPLAAAMAADPQPAASKLLFDQMMRDIAGGGGCADPMGQVSGSGVCCVVLGQQCLPCDAASTMDIRPQRHCTTRGSQACLHATWRQGGWHRNPSINGTSLTVECLPVERPLVSIARRGGSCAATLTTQACYALGYNLAIEYLADFEKTWMLDSFRHLDRSVLQPQGQRLTEWLFLEVSPHDLQKEPYGAKAQHGLMWSQEVIRTPLAFAAKPSSTCQLLLLSI